MRPKTAARSETTKIKGETGLGGDDWFATVTLKVEESLPPPESLTFKVTV